MVAPPSWKESRPRRKPAIASVLPCTLKGADVWLTSTVLWMKPSGWGSNHHYEFLEELMKTLEILWQRLVDERGQTCDRCGTTETAVEEAVQKLKCSLQGLEIDVVLEKKALTPSTFLEDPLESNRIWIAGEPIEEWLSATSGQSKCCSACGDSDCRTVTVDGETYEAIPAELIVKAGLLAGAQLLQSEPRSPCCSSAGSPKSSGCCPSS
jgi:hypothetical protein